MNTRDDRRARKPHRRILAAVLVAGIAGSVVLMAAGSGLPLVGATVDQQAAAAVATEWFGVPVGIAVWIGMGALALLAGLVLTLRPSRATADGVVTAPVIGHPDRDHSLPEPQHQWPVGAGQNLGAVG